jgi:hypothetical protein
MNTGEVVELFEGGWLPLEEGLPRVRVIVARHRVPAAGKPIKVGKRIGEWVYERFITTLDTDRFLVEDVLDRYHGRGAFEAVLADEDVEEDPDRWCSYTQCGKATVASGLPMGVEPAPLAWTDDAKRRVT